MAYLRRRTTDGRVEIRESVATPAGPRARTLAIFRGALTPDLLESAAARARGRFDRDALRVRAAELGITISERRSDAAARALLRELRCGAAPDPVLVPMLQSALAGLPAAEVPDELSDAAACIGWDAERRGRALRGLLRASDRLVRGRPRRRSRARKRFPLFDSGGRRRDVSSR
jgi:hypothetical protein